MRFSSFIAITAAGLAIAAPITPISPSNVEKQLTVEPVEVYKRQLPDTSAVSGLTKGLPIGKRQVDGLGSLVPGSSDASAEDDEDVVPKAPKEPKLPSSVSDDDEDDTEASEDDAEATDSATSALPVGGLPVGKRGLPLVGSLPLPVGKRQLDGLTGLLGGDKKDPAPADPSETPAADATTEDAEETPSPTPTPSPEATPAPAGGLGGILKKRQLSGLLGGDKKDADADDEDTTVKSNSQTNNADDGTNTPETKFSSDEPAEDEAEDETADETTEEATPTEDETKTEATPAAKETVPAAKEVVPTPAPAAAPAGGLGGLGGLLGM